MQSADGLVVQYSRCNAPARVEEWSDWIRERYAPELGAIGGVRANSHWALSVQPTPGMPSVGF